MNKDELLKSLMSLDFMAVDLGLFLNTHPENEEAVAEYDRIIRAADEVRSQYESQFGPLCSFRSYAGVCEDHENRRRCECKRGVGKSGFCILCRKYG